MPTGRSPNRRASRGSSVASALPWQITLSLLALEFASGGTAQREEAGIIGLIIVLLTVGVALIARRFGMNVGLRHQ